MDRPTVLVLGTNHAIQGVEKLDEAKKIHDPTYQILVEGLIEDHSLDYIFEEVGACGPTTASKLQRPGLGYLDVDPSGAERHLHGIPPGWSVEVYPIYGRNDPRPKPEPQAVIKKVAEADGREKVWVERINKVSFKKGLLICGVAHAFSVALRLAASDFSADDVLFYPVPTVTRFFLGNFIG